MKVGEGGSIREGSVPLTAQLRCSSQPLMNQPKGELDYFSQQSGPLVNPGSLMAQTDQSVFNASLTLDFHRLRCSRRNPAERGNARQKRQNVPERVSREMKIKETAKGNATPSVAL